ncbi:MAG TPA: exosortase-dependent surface protein XDP2 [Trichocoleus sp.]
MTSYSFRLIGAVGIASGALFLLSESASAFTFTNVVSDTSPRRDIFLESVLFETGEFFDDFILVNGVNIVSNDEWSGGNTGGASADRGEEATTGVAVQNPSSGDILTNLANLNLNNIIDTEDVGSFTIDFSFASAVENLLVWERGLNSRLGVQAIGADGSLIGNFLVLDSNTWQSAGFSIDTTEIPRPQQVGSLGVSVLNDLGVTGPVSRFRFTSEADFNGPDFKVVGTRAAAIPEPGMVMGLGIVGGALFLKRRYSRA